MAHLSIRRRYKFHIDRRPSFQLAFRSLSMSLLAFKIFKKIMVYGVRHLIKKYTSLIHPIHKFHLKKISKIPMVEFRLYS